MNTQTKYVINRIQIGFLLTFLLILQNNFCFAQKEVPFTLDDRDRIIRTETTIQGMQKQISDLKDDTNNRFNELQADLRWMIGVFISSILIIAGFILWDRRTFLKPFESRAIELESEVKNIKSILSAFRELAKMDNKVAQVLRQYNLL